MDGWTHVMGLRKSTANTDIQTHGDTHTHIQVHTYTHRHTETHTCPHPGKDRRAHIHTQTHTYMDPQAHIGTHRHTQKYTGTHVQVHTNTQVHTGAHRHTQAHIYMYIQTNTEGAFVCHTKCNSEKLPLKSTILLHALYIVKTYWYNPHMLLTLVGISSYIYKCHHGTSTLAGMLYIFLGKLYRGNSEGWTRTGTVTKNSTIGIINECLTQCDYNHTRSL